MQLSRIAPVLALAVSLSSCFSYQESTFPDVVVRESDISKYEVQIRKHVRGRGSLHSISFSKFEYDQSDWLYLDSVEGIVEADALVFTRHWRCVKYPWSDSNLKGTVEFKEGTLVIALERPWYEDGKTMTGYRPLDINGTYTVNFQNTRFEPSEADRNGACFNRSASHER